MRAYKGVSYMPGKNRNIDDIVDDLKRLNAEFRQKVQEGTKDADSFMKLHEIERLWSGLLSDTQKIYSDEIMDLLGQIDETDLIRKKKRVQGQRNQAQNPGTRKKGYLNYQWKNRTVQI